MKKIIFNTMLFAATITSFTACSTDEKEDTVFDKEVKTDLKSKSELPEWLADYVSSLEYVPEGLAIPESSSGIYRFVWKDNIYYEYYSSQSVMHEHIYTADGIPFKLTNSNYESFSNEVSDWTIVYVLKMSHEMPKKVIYPMDKSDMIKDFVSKEFNTARAYKTISIINRVKSDYQAEVWYRVDGDTACVVIDSAEQLKAMYKGNDQLPEIDYNRYSFLLGKIKVKKGDWALRRQEIRLDGRLRPSLCLFFESSSSLDINNPSNDSEDCFFGGLYPKLSIKSLDIIPYYNNVKDKPYQINYLDPYFPHTIDLYKRNWEVLQFVDGNLSLGDADGRFVCDYGDGHFSGIYKVDQLRGFRKGCTFWGDMKVTIDEVEVSKNNRIDKRLSPILYAYQYIEKYTISEDHATFHLSYFDNALLLDRFHFNSSGYYPSYNTLMTDESCKNIDDLIKTKLGQVSLSDFNKYVVGHSWKDVEVHELRYDGKYDKKNIWEYMAGYRVTTYEFNNDKVSDSIHEAKSYRYDETSNSLYFGDEKKFAILSLSEQKIVAFQYVNALNDNDELKPVLYRYVILKRHS